MASICSLPLADIVETSLWIHYSKNWWDQISMILFRNVMLNVPIRCETLFRAQIHNKISPFRNSGKTWGLAKRNARYNLSRMFAAPPCGAYSLFHRQMIWVLFFFRARSLSAPLHLEGTINLYLETPKTPYPEWTITVGSGCWKQWTPSIPFFCPCGLSALFYSGET